MMQEIREHLLNVIIPFWKKLKDSENGGYYGYMDYDLNIDKGAVKGCILNSRIVWFFSNAYMLLKDESLLEEARHGYEFMRKHFVDDVNGGVYWSVSYDGVPVETIKHTYNQAFSIYALSSYYEASGDEEALELAISLYHLIEDKCRDDIGYLEAFDREFRVIDNDKLSENGVMAYRTMNTLLHVFEAYTELYRVTGMEELEVKIKWTLDVFARQIYNPKLRRQEVFFDRDMNSIIDLHSYGHDIETAWLIDRCLKILDDDEYEALLKPVTKALTAEIYKVAFDGRSLPYECDKGVVNEMRDWWVQAETVVGFLNGYQEDNSKTEYLEAAKNEWEFIRDFQIDKREGSEWFGQVDKEGRPIVGEPLVSEWKCPYHNGRMCIEVLKRADVLGDI